MRKLPSKIKHSNSHLGKESLAVLRQVGSEGKLQKDPGSKGTFASPLPQSPAWGQRPHNAPGLCVLIPSDPPRGPLSWWLRGTLKVWGTWASRGPAKGEENTGGKRKVFPVIWTGFLRSNVRRDLLCNPPPHVKEFTGLSKTLHGISYTDHSKMIAFIKSAFHLSERGVLLAHLTHFTVRPHWDHAGMRGSGGKTGIGGSWCRTHHQELSILRIFTWIS